MNWNVRYARERKWIALDPTPPTAEWVGKTIPPVTQNINGRKFTVNKPEAIKSFTGTGGSTYTRNDDNTWTKVLSQEAQEGYKTTRPGQYTKLNPQGRYTETWSNTVFIHPDHNLADISGISIRPMQQPDGSFKYQTFGNLQGVPEKYIVKRRQDMPTAGNYIIPDEHISSFPFPGARPYQHGIVTFGDGSTRSNGHHIGHDVADIKLVDR